MKNVLLTLFAIGLAGIAAIAATTAMLNAPMVHNIAPPKSDKPGDPAKPGTAPTTPPDTPPATPPSGNPPAPAPAPAPAPNSGGAPTPAAGAAGSEEPESDQDPYEGIAPEDLPPDLQYDADSSVSFPTNT
jgi:hypothetical protein